MGIPGGNRACRCDRGGDGAVVEARTLLLQPIANKVEPLVS